MQNFTQQFAFFFTIMLCIKFLADRTSGRAYATVLRLSSVQNVLLLNGAS